MTAEAIVMILAAAGTFTTAVVAAVVFLWRTSGKQTRQNERTAVTQWREVADQQQRQIERQETLISELMETIEEIRNREGKYQVYLADLYGFLTLIYDYARRCGACLRENGQDPGELPPMPSRPEKRDHEQEEYERRTLEQKTRNVQQLSGIIPPPPPPPGGTKP